MPQTFIPMFAALLLKNNSYFVFYTLSFYPLSANLCQLHKHTVQQVSF